METKEQNQRELKRCADIANAYKRLGEEVYQAYALESWSDIDDLLKKFSKTLIKLQDVRNGSNR